MNKMNQETCFTHMENQIQNVQGKATKLFVRKKRERVSTLTWFKQSFKKELQNSTPGNGGWRWGEIATYAELKFKELLSSEEH